MMIKIEEKTVTSNKTSALLRRLERSPNIELILMKKTHLGGGTVSVSGVIWI